MKTVLYVNYYASVVSTRFLDGVLRYAHGAKWNVQVIDKVAEGSLRNLLEFWNPIGCIYGANDGIKPEILKILSRRPLVLLDCDQGFSWPNAGMVCSDSDSVADMVAREFLCMGLNSFAFCGYKEFYPWTERREQCFRKILALNGKRCESIWIDPNSSEDAQLKAALRHLVRPCGLFVANDHIGRTVLGACRMARIDVPGSIAVVGVDNDEHICERTKPTMSSILYDYEQAGQTAAAMLDEIAGGGVPRMEFYRARMFVRRGSTHAVRVQDRRVKDAVGFIRENVGKPMSASDVAKSMGCTLRMAELLFKRALEHSIRDEMIAARLDRAKRLLVDRRVGISAVANMCGYSDNSAFRRVFLAKTGCSMSEWRRRSVR